uniref:Uncharacterized protein n=1 Tax=Octopus bimaculoides TaxID=37653 RepID=A0A0L8GY00_OCTBM
MLKPPPPLSRVLIDQTWTVLYKHKLIYLIHIDHIFIDLFQIVKFHICKVRVLAKHYISRLLLVKAERTRIL